MKTETLEIQKAIYLSGYKIQLIFNDGVVRIINFSEFLNSSKNPMTTKYLNSKNFRNFKLKHGDLVWGDYEMCFPISDLHEGKI